MAQNELEDIVKGDELKVLRLFEIFGLDGNESLINRITKIIRELETHCVQYGIRVATNNTLIYGDLVQFNDMKVKLEKAIKTVNLQLIKIKQLKKKVKLLQNELADANCTISELKSGLGDKAVPVELKVEHIKHINRIKELEQQLARCKEELGYQKKEGNILNLQRDNIARKSIFTVCDKDGKEIIRGSRREICESMGWPNAVFSNVPRNFRYKNYTVHFMKTEQIDYATCSICGKTLPIEEFKTKHQYFKMCRKCRNKKYNKKFQKALREGKKDE